MVEARPDAARRNKTKSGQCSCTELRKASRRLSQLYDAALAPCGLRTTQRAILSHILRAGSPSMSELAEALVIDRGALAHNLKPLKRNWLVEIKVDSKDRRNHLVALTSAGRARLAESDVFWARAQRGFDAALGSVPSASLREALRLIVSDSFASTFEHAA